MRTSISVCAAVMAVTGAWANNSLATAQPASPAAASSAAPPPSQPPVSTQATWEQDAQRFGGVKADTRPCKDVMMKFTTPTEIREVVVRPGQRVKKGDVMVRARDADVLAALETQRFQATNDAEVRSQEAALELAAFRLAKGLESEVLAPAEKKELEIQEKNARIQVEAAKVRFQTEKLKLKYYEGQYERYRMEAPFDGVVAEVKVELGQGCTDQTDVIRIVNIDKMWLDAYPQTDESLELGLKEGSKAWVLMRLPGRSAVVEGRVIHVNPVADSVSGRRQVRVEIENREQWPAGTPTMVRFTDPAGTGGGKTGASTASTADGRSQR